MILRDYKKPILNSLEDPKNNPRGLNLSLSNYYEILEILPIQITSTGLFLFAQVICTPQNNTQKGFLGSGGRYG